MLHQHGYLANTPTLACPEEIRKQGNRSQRLDMLIDEKYFSRSHS